MSKSKSRRPRKTIHTKRKQVPPATPLKLDVHVAPHVPLTTIGEEVGINTEEPKVKVYHTARYPRDWWEALRERWWPRWAIKRNPIMYTEIVWWEWLSQASGVEPITTTTGGGTSVVGNSFVWNASMTNLPLGPARDEQS